MPVVFVSAMANASIITVGKLFITEDKNAAIKPIAIVDTNNPCSANVSMILANDSVNHAFPKPYTTTYIPIEKNTIFQGAPLITALVFTKGLFLDISKKKIAIIPATIDTGMLINSLVK